MSLNEKLEQKLRPHVDRVIAGNPNDYDYLPAVLFSGIDSTDKLIVLTKNEFATNNKLINDNNTEILNKIDGLKNEFLQKNDEIIKLQKINFVINIFLTIIIVLIIIFIKK